MSVCLCVCVRARVCGLTQACLCVCVYVHMYVGVSVCLCVCVYVRARVCVLAWPTWCDAICVRRAAHSTARKPLLPEITARVQDIWQSTWNNQITGYTSGIKAEMRKRKGMSNYFNDFCFSWWKQANSGVFYADYLYWQGLPEKVPWFCAFCCSARLSGGQWKIPRENTTDKDKEVSLRQICLNKDKKIFCSTTNGTRKSIQVQPAFLLSLVVDQKLQKILWRCFAVVVRQSFLLGEG